MNTNDKYYTPTIDEFYEGFEFKLQTVCDFGKSKDPRGYEVTTSLVAWIDQTFMLSYHNSIIKKALENNVVRVKYLDEQDIESLGFTRIGRGGDMIKFMKDDLEVNFHLDAKLNENENVNVTIYRITDLIFMDFRECLRLTIKNKSELKRLLNQLNIQ
jgi:hypothetical protein